MKKFSDTGGIGLIHFAGLEPAVESLSRYIDVLETEPQASWFKESLESDSFTIDKTVTSFLQACPQPKLFHGVGFPIGGTILPADAHFKTLQEHVRILQPLHISEHLSFNKYIDPQGGIHQANFLLPPLQNEHGIATAVKGIRYYKEQIALPFAFETGTNYLKPRPGDIPDGEFAARIAEESDSYILLDLHNLLANEKNGRQKVCDFIQQLPPERVIEIHLAGGMYYKDYYLDAHSAVSSTELLELTRDIVRMLPSLQYIIFEMLPENFNRTIAISDLENQLIAMHRLWDERGAAQKLSPSKQAATPSDNTVTSELWEYSLGSVVNDHAEENIVTSSLKNDKGTEIIQDLVFEFRASAILSTLKMTCRLIKLSLGSNRFNELLRRYCAAHPSELFIFATAERFARYLTEQKLVIPHLDTLLEFELASSYTSMDGKTRTVNFECDPFILIESLVNYKKPELPEHTEAIYAVEIQPDDVYQKNKSFMQYNSVFHN
jgi:uncharacterized protein